MQDENQTPGGDAPAPEPNNAPDPGAASPEELGQDAPAADPRAGAALPETAEQAGGGEVADAPAADPWGTPPPGPVEQEGPPLEDELEPDEPSASERVEPPGSDAAPIVEGEASPLIGGGGALPTEELGDEAFSGEEEGEGPPDAATAAEATAPTDATVGEAGGSGETIEDASESILDPPGAADIPQAFWRPPGITDQESNNTPDPWGGAALPETAEQAGGGEVADAPVADPWGTPPPETAPIEGDASHAGGVFDRLAEVDRLTKEHKAALDSVKETARAAGEAAKEAAEDVGEAVETGIGDVGEALENYVEDIPVVGDALGDATDAAHDALKGVGREAYDEAYWNTFAKEWTARVGPISEALKEAREDVGESVEAGIGDMGEALENYVEDIPIVGDALGDAVGDATDVAQDAVDDISW